MTRAEIERLSRNWAEVIHDLYRDDAAPRSRERLIELVQVQIKRVIGLCLRDNARRCDGE